jgi:metal-sulfur cluster biosynthetic enzyme
MQLKKKIIDKLKTVIDPEVREDIYSLKLIYDIQVDEVKKTVRMKFRPTVYNCPIGIQLALAVKRALLEIDELTKIDIRVTDFRMADEANKYIETLDKK